MKKLLIATKNPGKIAEYKIILKDLPLEIVTLGDLNIQADVEEDGKTFKENAIKKAKAFAQITKLLTLAEDAGLEVDALDGAPGVYSARYCQGTDEDRCKLLLKNLRCVSAKKRAARFKAIVAIFDPKTKKIKTCRGGLEGRIATKPKGKHGFGYDPVFYIPELKKTAAELTTQEKNKFSHRGKACWKAKKILEKF